MTKSPLVTKDVEMFIAKVYQDNPKCKAPEIQKLVSCYLSENYEKFPPNWPSLSKVQKILAVVRRKANELPIDPQDKPWSIDSLDNYPIPPHAIPIVLRAYRQHMKNGSDFTIRQAKWVSRLSAMESLDTSIPDQIAKTEQLYALIGQLPDLEVYDKLLAGLKAEANDLMPLFALASLAGILKNDLTKKRRREAHNER